MQQERDKMEEHIEVNARVWPVDVQELNQGDTINVKDMISVSPNHRDYALAILRIKGIIEKKLRQQAITLYLRIEGDHIRVMTDPELAEYERKAAYQGFRRLRTASNRLCDVDRDMLTEEERDRHDKAHIRIRHIEHAASIAARQRKIPTVRPTKRLTGLRIIKGEESNA